MICKDVRDHEAVDQAVEAIVKELGRIDVVLCAAGVVDNIPAHEYATQWYHGYCLILPLGTPQIVRPHFVLGADCLFRIQYSRG